MKTFPSKPIFPKSPIPAGTYGIAPMREFRKTPRTMFEAFGIDQSTPNQTIHSMYTAQDHKAKIEERIATVLTVVILLCLALTSCFYNLPHKH